MVSAIEGWARQLTGGTRQDQCEAGHSLHLTKAVLADFLGSFLVYDWERYEGTTGYCPGDDEVSKAIDINGVWERNETFVVLNVLPQRGVLLDFGAHVGWYSALADQMNCQVLALDADEEHLTVLRANTFRHQEPRRVTTTLGWLDKTTPTLEPSAPVDLVKIDVENAEVDAIRVLSPLLEKRLVSNVLIEVSPVFGPAWRTALDALVAYGYVGWLVPDVPTETPVRDTWQSPITVDRLEEWPQRSVLYTRPMT